MNAPKRHARPGKEFQATAIPKHTGATSTLKSHGTNEIMHDQFGEPLKKKRWGENTRPRKTWGA